MSVTGLSIDTKEFSFDIFKLDNGHFEIKSGGVRIEFPPDAVKLERAETFKTEFDPYEPYAMVMSVKWGCGHKVHFQAYMPLRKAQDLSKYFPELEVSL